MPKEERNLFSGIAAAMKGSGIVACDRHFDSREFVGHAAGLLIQTDVRVKETRRDVFGTGRSIPAELASAPVCHAVLASPTRRQKALVRWKESLFLGPGGCQLPVLIVSSAFDGCTLSLRHRFRSFRLARRDAEGRRGRR